MKAKRPLAWVGCASRLIRPIPIERSDQSSMLSKRSPATVKDWRAITHTTPTPMFSIINRARTNSPGSDVPWKTRLLNQLQDEEFSGVPGLAKQIGVLNAIATIHYPPGNIV